jgi:hypothetical protein
MTTADSRLITESAWHSIWLTDAGIRMRYEIIEDLYYELSAQHTHDNEPQSLGARTSDWSVVTSLGYSF